MNRAQREVVRSAVLMTVWVEASTYLLPAMPMPPAPSSAVQWGGRIYLPLLLLAWWGGGRQFHRRRLSPERRTVVLRCWHATFGLVAVPLLVSAVTGTSPLRWMVVLGMVGLWVTLFVERGGLSDAEFEVDRRRTRSRRRVFDAVMAGVVLLLLYLKLSGHGLVR